MSKTAAIVFFSILVVGVLISLLVLRPFVDTVEVEEKPEPPTVVETPGTEEEPVPEKKEEKPEPAKTESVAENPETPPKPEGYASPTAAMKALAGSIGGKDFEAFEKLVGKEAIAPEIRPEVKSLVVSPDYILSEKKPYTEVSKSATEVRWAFNFEPAPDTTTEISARQLYADLENVGNKSVDFKKISLPLVVETTSEGDDSAPIANLPDDPLTIAHTFSKAIIDRNFNVARSLSDPEKVTDERVAALMIAVEEGGFQMRENRPLVVTLAREDITWVLTRIASPSQSSEFALELGKSEDSWMVGGLTFSKVLSALADAAGGGDVAYSPIVEDPSGGDSLVLYFEFDSAGVTPRGTRQLAIIADILSQDSSRVIRINGHADALGTDQYNKVLSDSRAGAIGRALIEMGVSEEQVVTEAFGETKPRRPNFNPDGSDNPMGRSKNRRAEVYLDF
ncbi:MAG: OmpA family protein [Verrucomicrobiota bacterium]